MPPLSHLRWRAAARAFDRTREGTFNYFVLSHFAGKRGVRPVDVVPRILDGWRAAGHKVRWGRPRAYVQQRVYELGRRGVLEIREVVS